MNAKSAAAAMPIEENFADLFNEMSGGGSLEGTVVKGTVISVENDFVSIDVGLKCEGRVSLKEFGSPGMPAE